MQKIALAFAMLLGSATLVAAGETAAPADAKVYFINIKDGDTVKSPVKIQFGLSGMGIAPAGVETADTDIDGIHADGRRVPVFRKGEWA